MHLDLRAEKEKLISNATYQGGGEALKALIAAKRALYGTIRANRGGPGCLNRFSAPVSGALCQG